MPTDLKLTPDGDLALTPDGDLDLVSGHDYVVQQAKIRIRSTDPDIFGWPQLCASLLELRGRPNNRDTAEEGTARILRALTADGLLKPEDIYIRAVPTGYYTITWFVFINRDGHDATGVEVTLDLNRGVIVKGVRE